MQKRSLSAAVKWVAVATLALGVCGCADTPESAIDRLVAKSEDLLGVLQTVKDKKTADEALPKGKEIGKSMRETVAKLNEMEKPDLETANKIQAKHEAKLKELTPKLMAEVFRVTFISPEIARELQPALEASKNSPLR